MTIAVEMVSGWTQGFTFTVYGTPTPQGSMRAFFKQGMKRPILTSDNPKTKPWKQEISGAALALNRSILERTVPVHIDLDFYFTRPPSCKKRKAITVKPDIDKLQRAVLDAITGILITDDAQVVAIHARKFYGDPERVEITVKEQL